MSRISFDELMVIQSFNTYQLGFYGSFMYQFFTCLLLSYVMDIFPKHVGSWLVNAYIEGNDLT